MMNNDLILQIYQGDALAHLKEMQDNSYDAIVTDPPYYGVLDTKITKMTEDWDNAWNNEKAFLDWVKEVIIEMKRVLKPNGSLYWFCSPKMSAKIEVVISEQFEVFNSLIWNKPENGFKCKTRKEALRKFIPFTERIIFAGHYNSDNYANGSVGYDKKCDELRGFLFEPIRKYLADAWYSSGLSSSDAIRLIGLGTVQHYFTPSHWTLPTPKKYELMQQHCPALTRSYDSLKEQYDELKEQYDELKEQYRALRRPFNVTAQVQYGDVWSFKSAPTYKGRHACEKPQDLIEHILNASTLPNHKILDPFAGSGAIGEACRRLGRHYTGIELDYSWALKAETRCKGF